MVRIRIIGGPGSGKTTFAKKLSEKLNVPQYDLDDVYFEDDDVNHEKVRDVKKRFVVVKKIVAQKNWIIDGSNFGAWTVSSLANANQIVVLTVPRFIRAGRLVKRFLKRTLGVEPYRKKEVLWNQHRLIHWNHKYDKEMAKRLDLKQYGKKVIYLRTQKEMESFLHVTSRRKEKRA